MAEQTQTAYAKSIFTDLTAWAFVGAGALLDPDVQAFIVSLGANQAIVAKCVIGVGLLLRYSSAKRPVAFIAPMQVKPVEIPKLEKTQQGSETPGK